MWPFSYIKKLKAENTELRDLISTLNKPLKFDKPLVGDEFLKLTTDEQVLRFRKLDLILTLKKTNRWDYDNNCAAIPANTTE